MKQTNITAIIARMILCLALGAGMQSLRAQHKEAYNWYFGAYVGMTWKTTQTVGGLSGLPTPLPASAMTNQYEGVFGMSDANGNLLFYSNGMTVWNRNHQVMTNGTALTGNSSSAQSGIVIPYPGQPRKYIAVTVGLNMGNTLACSIIDMEGSGGLGEVMASYNGIAKNTPLTGASGVLGESVAAVRHANGRDYWIVAPGKGSGAASALNVWKVTAAGGVETACFASYPLPANTEPDASINGYLRFSANGKYFAWSEYTPNHLFFGEFNPSNGTFPTIKMMNTGYTGYGLEFSPSKEILYATTYSSKVIHAYPFEDLLASANPGSVPHRTVTTGAANNLSALQLGPDGRIYSPVYSTTSMLVIDRVDDYNGFTTHPVSGLLPTVSGYQAFAGLPNYMPHLLASVENTCSQFTDDLWYFGIGGGGIAFNDAGNGAKTAVSASGESLVGSEENSLSVSSPGCGSSLIFYSQHDRLYNAKHQPMVNGSFSGDESVADGLAACYIGDNKYMLFSVTSAYERGTAMGLQYHIIDMNEDNGYGRRISTATLETSGMAESVELTPVPGTSDEYWLIYNMVSPNEIRVRKITGSTIGAPKSPALSMSGRGVSGKSYIFRANSTYNRLVLTYPDDNKMALLDFDASAGNLTFNRVKSAPFTSGDIFGAEFSPNGKYVYCTTYYGDCEISQYDIAGDTFTSPFLYGDDASGGGLKPGPDGRLYVKREGRYMGVIADPDAPLTPAGYARNGFDLGAGVFSFGLTFSTGLTPPAVCPSGLNEAPVTADDAVTVFSDGPSVCLSVLENDYDPNPGNSINLINVFFQHTADANKIEVSFQPGDSTVCIRAKAAAQEGDVIRLTYTVRDDANPIRLCADATITVRIGKYPENIIDADCRTVAPTFVWGIRELPVNTTTIDNYQQILTGDIDNDGEVEIIAYMDGSSVAGSPSGGYDTNGLRMFVVRNGAVVEKRNWLFKNLSSAQLYASSLATCAIARHNGEAYVVIAATDGYLYACNYDGTPRWKSDAVYTATGVSNDGTINITDFNGDGIPEIWSGKRIFSLTNGKLLCDGSSAGSAVGVWGYNAVADMDGNGTQEIVAGNQIYKVTITNPAGTAGNAIALMTGGYEYTGALPANIIADGRTHVADFDLDGELEVLVVTLTGGRSGAYLWKPNPGGTATLLGSYVGSPTSISAVGPALIGNIDADPNPEAVYIANGSPLLMFALKYDATKTVGSRLVQKWTLGHTDTSGCTGMSLFDFDSDGKNEICYRDEQTLRIIDGSGTSASVAPGNTFNNVTSGTRIEMPVIADVDGDGQAEMIINGHTGTIGETGYLRVFKAAVGGQWAAARKVWNTYSYRSLNVNDDLTVPAHQLSPATRFAGRNGILGDSDDVFPYNNLFQQQTNLDVNGVPLWTLPRAQVDSTFYFYDAAKDSMFVTVDVINAGNAPFPAPFHITVYKNAPGNAVKHTYAYPGFISEKDTARITFGIPGYLASWVDAEQLYFRANDAGNTFNAQQVCDSLLRDKTEGPILLALNDYASTLATVPVTVAVLANDSIPAGCTPVLSPLTGITAHGATVTKVNDSLRYHITDPLFSGFDTVTYRISCNGKTSIARMSVLVNEIPDNITDADCYTLPPADIWSIKEVPNSLGGNFSAIQT
ncbi:MAG: VCBS repeat-containing protein, partial [Tannerella sp.]|nr:VCBS repeat-containing protein [Tannerella sp.]